MNTLKHMSSRELYYLILHLQDMGEYDSPDDYKLRDAVNQEIYDRLLRLEELEA